MAAQISFRSSLCCHNQATFALPGHSTALCVTEKDHKLISHGLQCTGRGHLGLACIFYDLVLWQQHFYYISTGQDISWQRQRLQDVHTTASQVTHRICVILLRILTCLVRMQSSTKCICCNSAAGKAGSQRRLRMRAKHRGHICLCTTPDATSASLQRT